MSKKKIYLGVDVGSSFCKVAALDDDGKLLGWACRRSGIDFGETAQIGADSALSRAQATFDDVACCISTGYGRGNVAFTNGTKSEIGCHAKGAYHEFPTAITIIDVGGQDNKVIVVNAKGDREKFTMNRKCAAGTGAFIEEQSLRLHVDISQMESLARQSSDPTEIASFCSVYAGTELLEKIRGGAKIPDIVRGIFVSVAKRVLAMARFSDTPTIMTGGVVEHNPIIAEIMKELSGADIRVPMHPQLCGAVGAALYAQHAAGKA